MPFYPLAGPRRRLRHHRLLRRRPAARQPRRLRRGHPHRPRPRHPGHRRPRRQPHLRPAPLVRRRRGAAPRQPVPRLLRVARRPTRVTPPPRWSSPTRRTASGRRTSAPASGTCTTSTRTSPTSTSPTRRCRTRSAHHRLLAGARASTASGSTPCRSSCRTRTTPARGRWRSDPHDVITRAARVPAAPQGRRDAARRGQPALTRSSGSSSAATTATSCTMHVRLHRHAGDVPLAGPRGRRGRWSRRCETPAEDPPRPASGPRSCATTTS